MRESYSKNPLMRLVFVVKKDSEESENEKKQTERQKQTGAKAKFCLFFFR